MKKTGLLALFASVSIFASAQKSAKSIEFSVNMGADVTSLHIKNQLTENLTSSSRSGIVGGIGVHGHISPKVDLQSGLEYTQMGAVLAGNLFNQSFGNDVHLRLGYINVPLLFTYKLTPKFHVMGGPALSFLTNARYTVQGGSTFSSKDKFNANDWFGVVGAGYRFTILQKNFNVQAKYLYGLTDIIKDANSNSNNSLYNRGATITIGYFL